MCVCVYVCVCVCVCVYAFHGESWREREARPCTGLTVVTIVAGSAWVFNAAVDVVGTHGGGQRQRQRGAQQEKERGRWREPHPEG